MPSSPDCSSSDKSKKKLSVKDSYSSSKLTEQPSPVYHVETQPTVEDEEDKPECKPDIVKRCRKNYQWIRRTVNKDLRKFTNGDKAEKSNYCLKISNFPVYWSLDQVKEVILREYGLTDYIHMAADNDMCFVGMVKLEFVNFHECQDAWEKLHGKYVEDVKLFAEVKDMTEQSDDESSPPKRSKKDSTVDSKQDIDIWEPDPSGLYGFKEEYLASLGIKPPIDRWVHVTNFRCDKSELKEVLELAGHVLICSVDSRLQKFAKVMYSHPLEAVQAVSMLNNQQFYGQSLKVTMERCPVGVTFLPKGLYSIGPGLGVEGKPLRDIVHQYERFVRYKSSFVNSSIFRSLDVSIPTPPVAFSQTDFHNETGGKGSPMDLAGTSNSSRANSPSLKYSSVEITVQPDDDDVKPELDPESTKESEDGISEKSAISGSEVGIDEPGSKGDSRSISMPKSKSETDLATNGSDNVFGSKAVGSKRDTDSKTWLKSEMGLKNETEQKGSGSGPMVKPGPLLGTGPLGPLCGPGRMYGSGSMGGPGPMGWPRSMGGPGPMGGPRPIGPGLRGGPGPMCGPGQIGGLGPIGPRTMGGPGPMGGLGPMGGPGPMGGSGAMGGPGPMGGSGPIGGPGPMGGSGPMGGLGPMRGPGQMGGSVPMGGPGPMAGSRTGGPSPLANSIAVELYNLPPSTTFPLLSDKMGECGKVVSLQLTTPGCAIVQFVDKMAAQRCYQMYNNRNILGNIITVNLL